MSTEYSEASSAKTIAERLINDHHPHLKDAKIAFLLHEKQQPRTTRRRVSSGGKKKAPRVGRRRIYGRASLFSPKAKWAAELIADGPSPDFVVEFREELWDLLTLEQQEALVDHELSHCGKDSDGWYIKHHDVEEFSSIIERHGLWESGLERFAASIDKMRQLALEFPPAEEGQKVERDPDRELATVATFSRKAKDGKSAAAGN